MTHCGGDECHFFCLVCAHSNAANEIGLGRYKIKCMDGSGCQAEFPHDEKLRFLNDKEMGALDRNQRETELHMAGLDDLVRCPFCDFAAICPAVEVDREFRCLNAECERVSCRLCQQDTHIPLSCKEYAKENKLTVRHVVEEAMTDALIRSCK
jgi:TRIAD3 protein (E3 ubiquitin-protein ligase RNF216)